MKLRTQLLLGYLAVFVLMAIATWVTVAAIRTVLATQDMVEASYQVMADARGLEEAVIDMQNSKRGFLLTGDESFLEPFESARKRFDAQLQQLRQRSAGNHRQLGRLQEIGDLVDRWLDTIAAAQIAARKELPAAGTGLGGFVAKVEREGLGQELVDQVRDRVTAFVDVERDLLLQHERRAAATAARAVGTAVVGGGLAILLGLGAMAITTRAILLQVGDEPNRIAGAADEIARGNLELGLGSDGAAATGIKASLIEMLAALRANRKEAQRRDWLKTGLARLNEIMAGDPAVDELASRVVGEVCSYLELHVGALYLVDAADRGALALKGTWAYTHRKSLSNRFAMGEGLIGQAALERRQIVLSEVPEDYVVVASGLGRRHPGALCVTPFSHEGRLLGVLEVGSLGELGDRALDYLEQATPMIAVAFDSARSRAELASSLAEARRLTDELQAQQEELTATNEELEEQTRRLEESEERLRNQQEELEVTNEELEEKNELLEQQKKDVERARREIEETARELAQASQYKSEFLANMSHELRTPLNSLLLLAQSLAENRPGNLSPEQVEAAQVIHGSGSDLLNLINEILDLSKIEAGRMDLNPEEVSLASLAGSLEATFRHLAEGKGLAFDVTVGEAAPAAITTDRKRLGQVLKNLLANAVKFTDQGGVTVRFGLPAADADLSRSGLDPARALAIAVTDSGIGIAPEHQRRIFEAFQQADGSTARRYGGTGLGLSVSRELATLLGGEIQVASTLGEGATFVLYLPLEIAGRAGVRSVAQVRGPAVGSRSPAPPPSPEPPPATRPGRAVPDDRDDLADGDTVILVVEDDPAFAKVLYDTCRGRGLKCLVAGTGEEGLELARRSLPSGVLLDLRLPGIDGWTVLASLKDSVRTRHIPVHIISVEDPSTASFHRGAIGHATKPIDRAALEEAFERVEAAAARSVRRVLVVEDDAVVRNDVVELIRDTDVAVDAVGTGGEALAAIRGTHYDCVILDIGLPDMDGRDLLARLEAEQVEVPPVVVHTARDLTAEQELAVREHADSIVVKDVRSRERLLDEVSLFLHQMVATMPERKRQIIRSLHETDELLAGRTVLVVDDDMRTLFAVSKLLADHGLTALKADNGERALGLLGDHPEVDLVLMDIMMPVLDGYETMRRIRALDGPARQLPIIALTAKAMPEDRARCLEAGANDYLAKPVDAERLLSLLRVWLYR